MNASPVQFCESVFSPSGGFTENGVEEDDTVKSRLYPMKSECLFIQT